MTAALLAPVLWRSHPMSPLILLGATLVTFKAVLLLPVFWVAALLQERRPALRDYLPWFGACVLGLVLVHTLWPESFRAQGANLLEPLLGWRWLPNLVWVLMALLVGAACWPRGTGFGLRRGWLALGTGAWLGLLGIVVRLGGQGWDAAAGHLIWSALPFLALGGLQKAGRGRGLLWLGCALALTGMYLRPFFLDASLPLGQERLLVPPGRVSGAGIPQVPGLRFYADADELHALLQQEARHPGRRPLMVLAPNQPDRPWLQRKPDGAFLFRPELFPASQVLFSSLEPRRRAGTCTGLHDDGVWTRDLFTLAYTLEKTSPATLEIRRRDWRPPQAGPLVPRMTVRLDGRPLKLLQDQKTLTRWEIPVAGRAPGPHVLEIGAPTFVPRRDVPGATDQRALGVDLKEIVLR